MGKEEIPKWAGIGSKFAHLTSAHPCFGVKAHFSVARMHLPVAPRCNIQCKYCVRRLDKCEQRPGVAACIMDEEAALRRLESEVKSNPNLKVVGIAGPGDPLANEMTYRILGRIKEKFPNLLLCLSTNGLLLEEAAERLRSLGVKTVTITINAVNPKVGASIYEWVWYGGTLLRGEEGAELLIKKQLRGIEELVKRGIVVRINTVLIPTVNQDEVESIASEAARRGASLMNIIPLIPQHEFKSLRRPTCEELERARKQAEKYIPQFRLCRQCRADAVGIPGRESQGTTPSEYFHG
ncbi:MAG: radical SAM protein [Candidatus Verstraetearchaeota archaeon]|nr:radical SAM protein [Candidatus Verstraetearchaeota archaeon]